MKKLVLLFVLSACVCITVNAQQISERDYIEVRGAHTDEIAPDSIVLSIVLKDNSSATKSDILKQEKTMVDALKKIGIDAKESLKIDNYSTYNVKRNNMSSTKKFSLILDGYESVNEVIYTLNNAGIMDVAVKYTGLKNVKQLLLGAKTKALQDAKFQAQTMVESMGYKLGKVILIVDSNSYYNNPVLLRSNSSTMKDAVASETFEALSDIEFQPVKLTANVTVRFLIE